MILVNDGVNDSDEFNALKEWKIRIFNIVDKSLIHITQISYLLNLNVTLDIRGMVSKNFIESMFWFQETRLQTTMLNTLKQKLNGTKAYEETSIDEKSVVYSHSNEIPNKFTVDVK